MKTFCIASNGVIHRDGCVHAARIKVLSGDWETVAKARHIAEMDFEKVRVAPCAKEETR